MSNRSISSRQEVTSLFVPHPRFLEAQAKLNYVLTLTGEDDDEMPGTLVIGHARSGKSTLLRKMIEAGGEVEKDGVVLENFRYSARAVADRIPVVHFTMPTQPTSINVGWQLLRALGDPDWDRETRGARVRARAEYLLATCRPRALCIDEAHHAVDRSGTVFEEELADWLKVLLDVTKVPQVLFGLHRAQHLFEHNEQLRARYDRVIEINGYTCFAEHDQTVVTSEEDLDTFLGILEAFLAKLSLKHRLDLDDEMLARRFYYATRGLIGFVKKLLRAAVEIVQLENRPATLDLALLEAAFERAVMRKWDGPVLVNPFARAFDGRLPPKIGTDSEFGTSRRKRLRGKRELLRKVNHMLSR